MPKSPMLLTARFLSLSTSRDNMSENRNLSAILFVTPQTPIQVSAGYKTHVSTSISGACVNLLLPTKASGGRSMICKHAISKQFVMYNFLTKRLNTQSDGVQESNDKSVTMPFAKSWRCYQNKKQLHFISLAIRVRQIQFSNRGSVYEWTSDSMVVNSCTATTRCTASSLKYGKTRSLWVTCALQEYARSFS